MCLRVRSGAVSIEVPVVDSVLDVFSILMLVTSSTNATTSLAACNSDQGMSQGGVCCQCEACMGRIAAPLHVLSGSLIFSDMRMRSLPLHTVHLCAVVQCRHLPHGGAVDLSALHGVVASPGYCTLCSSMLGAARS